MKRLSRLFYALALRCGHKEQPAPHWAHDCAWCHKPRKQGEQYRILAWEHRACPGEGRVGPLATLMDRGEL